MTNNDKTKLIVKAVEEADLLFIEHQHQNSIRKSRRHLPRDQPGRGDVHLL